MSKIRISLEITAVIEEDGTYFGANSTLAATVASIKRDRDNYKLFISRGANEPTRVPATVKIKYITFTDVEA